MAGKGGSSDQVIVANPGGLEKPKSLLDAQKEIQNMAGFEKNNPGGIDPLFYAFKDRIDMSVVGFKSSFLSGLIVALLTPLAIGVVERIIPIFGDRNPTVFDQVYALVLALGFTLGHGFFFASLRSCYVGNVTKVMIKNLIGGAIGGAVLKTILVVIVFNYLYFYFTAQRLVSMLLFLHHAFLIKKLFSDERLYGLYAKLLAFRPVLLMSAWFVFLSMVLYIAIPTVAIAATAFKNRKKEV